MHPLLFEISLGTLGIFRVPAFGALLALALGVGLALTSKAAERAGLSREPVLGAYLVALFAALVGARLGFVSLHPSEVGSLGEAISLSNGGLSSTLGLLAGGAALVLAARRGALPWRRLFDLAAPAFGLGVVLVRLGCWLEGCDYGKRLAASAPAWLARLGAFPLGSPPFIDQAVAGEVAVNAPRALPVHPSELYESLAGVVLVGLALGLKRRALPPGLTALAVCVSYFALRVAIDFTRVPSADVWCARIVFAGALGVTAWWLSRRARARRP